MTDLQPAELEAWIGREESVVDWLTPTLAERFYAMLDLDGPPPTRGGVMPQLIHFCLCAPAAPTHALGPDGHPLRGGFLPPVPLPRRMWAGSDVEFLADLRVGDEVTRHSRVADITVKQGVTGALCFVGVDHAFSVEGRIAVRERQTIVYCEIPPAGSGRQPALPATVAAVEQSCPTSPTLLFRYSALTFNGHRIHYDHPNTVLVEGYQGLVVHGPLQATWLSHLARLQREGAPLRHFAFRGQSPAICNTPVMLHATADGIDLWASSEGRLTMTATAGWA